MLVEAAADPAAVLVGFHGYGQLADDMFDELRRVPGADRWTIVSVQALHPFYARGDSKVVASWMTRQDRELAIADNTAYALSAVDAAVPGASDTASGRRPPLVFVGFSQGVAMAYRAALRSSRPAAGVVALAGDIPPELRDDPSLRWPPVLIGVGDQETWYTGGKLDADLAFLQTRGVAHDLVRFEGGHEWTDAFRASVGAWIDRLG